MTILTEKYIEAVRFASEKHKNQIRKVAPFPYVVHLYEVSQILRESGEDEETIIGGILHDSVEDVGVTLEEIKEKFGERVATYVDFVSEKKGIPYVQRKWEHAERLKTGPIEAKKIKCADCVANLRSIYLDELNGIKPFSKFNSTRENIKEHYRHSIEVFSPLKDTEMYKWLVHYYQLVFEK